MQRHGRKSREGRDKEARAAANFSRTNVFLRDDTAMDLQLTNKLALVSGSTAGIGFAIATGLAREGARVIVNGRTEKRVSAAVERIRSGNADAKLEGIAADLGSSAGVEEVARRFPDVDILVNNLGIFE